jgi:hypothetical protein
MSNVTTIHCMYTNTVQSWLSQCGLLRVKLELSGDSGVSFQCDHCGSNGWSQDGERGTLKYCIITPDHSRSDCRVTMKASIHVSIICNLT